MFKSLLKSAVVIAGLYAISPTMAADAPAADKAQPESISPAHKDGKKCDHKNGEPCPHHRADKHQHDEKHHGKHPEKCEHEKQPG